LEKVYPEFHPGAIICAARDAGWGSICGLIKFSFVEIFDAVYFVTGELQFAIAFF